MKIYKELLTAFTVISVFYLFIFSLAVWLDVANFNFMSFLFGILNAVGALTLIKNRVFPFRNVFYSVLFFANIWALVYSLNILLKDINFFPLLCHKIVYAFIGSVVFSISFLKTIGIIRNKIDI